MSGSVCKGHVMYSMCEHAVTWGQELWSTYQPPHSLPGHQTHILDTATAETLWNACIAVSSHTIYCGRHKSLNWNDSSASLCWTVEAFKSNGQYFTRFWQVGWLSRLFGTGHLCRFVKFTGRKALTFKVFLLASGKIKSETEHSKPRSVSNIYYLVSLENM